MLPNYEVYAIKYATQDRTASANFIGGDSHDGPMPIDYFVWVIKNDEEVWVVDCGFDESSASERGRTLLRSVPEGLKQINVDAARVEQLIITHMHYDHIGNLGAFPQARFHLQDREMAFATGRYMRHHALREGYCLRDVKEVIDEVYAERVDFHDGDVQLTPGLSLHTVGGHTNGLQVVRVHTRRGWIVLASDASHFYRNMDENKPYPITFHIGDMLEGYRRLDELADSHDHIIPGHDPSVLSRYSAPNPSLDGVIATLHDAPKLC